MSDFGLRDNYVGVVKGIMMDINPDLRIVDISHGITPFAIGEANYLISTAYHYFPKETVHLVVVDPGVGTKRSALILRSASHYFVGPDNGIFTNLIQHEGVKCYAIRRKALNSIAGINRRSSRTFDGRDLFGPAAALLSRGVRIGDLAEPMVKDPVLVEEPFADRKGKIRIRIIHIDHFGNIITELHRNHLKDGLKVRSVKTTANVIKVVSSSYQEVREGEALAIWGSNGFLEISVNQGDAAKSLKYTIGDSIEVDLA
jgi:S-adenosylmethionine hydrolase